MFRDVDLAAVDVQKAPEVVGLLVRGSRWLIADYQTMVVALREMSVRSGLTYSEIAARIGMNHSTLTKYYLDPYANQYRPASVRKLAQIAAVCGGRLILEIPDGSSTSI